MLPNEILFAWDDGVRLETRRTQRVRQIQIPARFERSAFATFKSRRDLNLEVFVTPRHSGDASAGGLRSVRFVGVRS